MSITLRIVDNNAPPLVKLRCVLIEERGWVMDHCEPPYKYHRSHQFHPFVHTNSIPFSSARTRKNRCEQRSCVSALLADWRANPPLTFACQPTGIPPDYTATGELCEPPTAAKPQLMSIHRLWRRHAGVRRRSRGGSVLGQRCRSGTARPDCERAALFRPHA